MREDGVKVASNVHYVLFAKNGFKQNLIDAAAERDDVRLVELDDLIDGIA